MRRSKLSLRAYVDLMAVAPSILARGMDEKAQTAVVDSVMLLLGMPLGAGTAPPQQKAATGKRKGVRSAK